MFHDNETPESAVLEAFHPNVLETHALPEAVPDGITREFREAELCASAGAWRAASAMVRSVLEKTLVANGYRRGSLAQKIDKAANEHVITDARRSRAHDEVRVLGNDVLHEEWFEVESADVAAALRYAQRILEDLYDDRPRVEGLLKRADRLQPNGTPSEGASA